MLSSDSIHTKIVKMIRSSIYVARLQNNTPFVVDAASHTPTKVQANVNIEERGIKAQMLPVLWMYETTSSHSKYSKENNALASIVPRIRFLVRKPPQSWNSVADLCSSPSAIIMDSGSPVIGALIPSDSISGLSVYFLFIHHINHISKSV